ncbi:MAG: ABC transporter ATP-binding protein [Candidatus Brocadiae bacterium]|nr:ABC transporter ATP-binding protein [Candidatus Brocadiia bacterium]
MIQVKSLFKHYQMGTEIVHALDGVSFQIDKGEFVAITGSSGSGKSTLMNILGCLDVPTEGDYFLNAKNVSSMNKKELARIRNREIGFVFQNFSLLPRMTAWENVELPLLYAGNKEAKDLAKGALEKVGLGERIFHEPKQLSGGQCQRVAIARAIVHNPSIILADEPTGNLDSRTSEEIMQIFKDLNASGRTIILVTHESDIAIQCKRVIQVKDGKILKDYFNN